ncbi:DUF397 domain-containing protein [Streptomyces sp. NPDC001678]|uniref:DUF397 domain-containing protein n=1 Tax=Streptomyces sp. NPDC001678 TaxID=3364599 RepID=UPI0036917082
MHTDRHILAWRKSSYSGAGDEHGGDNCLEFDDSRNDSVHVRDSKDPYGPVLSLPAAAWAAFTATLR